MDKKNIDKPKMKSLKPLIHSSSGVLSHDPLESKLKGNEAMLRKLTPSAYLDSLNIKKMKGLGKKPLLASAGGNTQANQNPEKTVKRQTPGRPSPNMLARAQRLQSAINFYEPHRAASISTTTMRNNSENKLPTFEAPSDNNTRVRSRSKPITGATANNSAQKGKPIDNLSSFLRKNSNPAALRPLKRPLSTDQGKSANPSPYKKPPLPPVSSQPMRSRSKQLNSISVDNQEKEVSTVLNSTRATRLRQLTRDNASVKDSPQPSTRPRSRQLSKDQVPSGIDRVTTLSSAARPESRQSLQSKKELQTQGNDQSLPRTRSKQPARESTTETMTAKRTRITSKENTESTNVKKRVSFTHENTKAPMPRPATVEKVVRRNNDATSEKRNFSCAPLSQKQDVGVNAPKPKTPPPPPVADVPDVKRPTTSLPSLCPSSTDSSPPKAPEKVKLPHTPTSTRPSSRPGTSNSARSSRPTSASSVVRMSVANCGASFSSVLAQTLKLVTANKKLKEAGDGPDEIKTDNIDNLPFPHQKPGQRSSGAEGDAFNPPVNTPVSPKSPTSDSGEANESSSQEELCRKALEIDDGTDICSRSHAVMQRDKYTDTSGPDFVTDYLQVESMKQVNHITHAIARAKICGLVKGSDPNLTLEQLKAAKSHYLQLPCFADPKFFARIRVPPHIFMSGKALDRDLLTLQYLQNKMDNLYQKDLKSHEEKQFRRTRLPPITEEPLLPRPQLNHQHQSNHQPCRTKIKTPEVDMLGMSKGDSYLQSFHKLFQSIQLPPWAKECFGSGSENEEDEEEGYITTSTEEEVHVKPTPDNAAERAAVAQKILRMFENGSSNKKSTDEATLSDISLNMKVPDIDLSPKESDEDASSPPTTP